MAKLTVINYESLETYFDQFCSSTTYEGICFAFDRLCDAANLKNLPGNGKFYKELRRKLSFYWKAQALFENIDARFNDGVYFNQRVCKNIQAIVVGFGPCGLRSSIELALLGANVAVIDKRKSFSRHNVLHLWPYLISDLKSLGAKSFFGKFCAGSIDHISIRTLQCILLKVALLLGVQIVPGVEFRSLIQPSDDVEESVDVASGDGEGHVQLAQDCRPLRDLFTLHQGERRARRGWRMEVTPHHEDLSAFELDALIDATGKSHGCLNFPRKVLRCRLAIAVTMNFINYGNVEEAYAEEISGVASIFNQPYFAQISKTLGIELENLVYYKDATHYFVMTIKKKSLLAKGVLIEDLDDPKKLLSEENLNSSALEQLARDVASFATRGVLHRLDFALNSRGKPDVAVFDFTNLSAAQYSCRIVDRKGRPLCQCLVGDALLEPFWPRGSGCALGFLSALDAAWAVSLFAEGHHSLSVIAWRDSVYQRLSQTSPSNMQPNFASYSLLPSTRYTCVDLELVRPMQIRHLYDSDVTVNMTDRKSFTFLRDSVKFDFPDVKPSTTFTITTEKNNNCSSKSVFNPRISLLKWYQQRLSPYPCAFCPPIEDLVGETWADGRALRCLFHKYSSDLVSEEDLKTPIEVEVIIRLFAEHFGALGAPADMGWPRYLNALYNHLKGFDPAFVAKTIVRTELGNFLNQHIDPLSSPYVSSRARQQGTPCPQSKLKKPIVTCAEPAMVRARCAIEEGLLSKRKSELIAMLNDPASAKRRSLLIDREKALEDTGHQPSAGLFPRNNHLVNGTPSFGENSRDFCTVCKKSLYAAESRAYDGLRLHPKCFRCIECLRPLRPDIAYCLHHPTDPKFYCTAHFRPMSTAAKTTNPNPEMLIRNSVLAKPRSHNAPSLFYGLASSTSPPRSRCCQPDGSTVTSKGGDHTKPPPRAPRLRVATRGIRDEPAAPVLLTSRTVPGTIGLPECVRRTAFDERLYHLSGYPQPESFFSNVTSHNFEDEEDCFASSENEPSDLESTTGDAPMTSNPSPPMSIKEAVYLCRMKRDEGFYRRHHPPTESPSTSDEFNEKSKDVNPKDNGDSQLVALNNFDTPNSVSECSNVRWALLRPPPPYVPPTIVSSILSDPLPLIQKCGPSGSMLLAKQHFCMADPEPIRIDPRNFRATKNQERTAEAVLSDCTEQLEFLPNENPIFLPLTDMVFSTDMGMRFTIPCDQVKVVSLCVSSPELCEVLHANPIEPLLFLPSVPFYIVGSTVFSIVSERTYEICYQDKKPIQISQQGSVNMDCITKDEVVPTQRYSSTVKAEAVMARMQKTNAPDSTVVIDYSHVLETSQRSQGDAGVHSTLMVLTSSSEEEEEEDFFPRSIVLPPMELSGQLKGYMDQRVHPNDVPLYILTSKLDSDDDQRFVDPQDEEEDEEDTTDSSTSDEFLPSVSESHAKQIGALKTRLFQLEKEMRDLERQGMEKERSLRALENASEQSRTDLLTQILSISEPDLSLSSKKSPKREINSRWRWVRSKWPVRRQSSGIDKSRPLTTAHEVAENSERARLFAELLAVISERDNLVTQEAVIMAELKKIELESYEEFLQQALDSIQRPGDEVLFRRSKVTAFRRSSLGHLRGKRISSMNCEPLRENRIKQLINEMSKISKEKTALTAVQGETMQRANLQQLCVHEALSRRQAALRRDFFPYSCDDNH